MIYSYKGSRIVASTRKEAISKIIAITNKPQLLNFMCNQLGFSLPFQIKIGNNKEEEKKEFLSKAIKDKDVSITDLLKKDTFNKYSEAAVDAYEKMENECVEFSEKIRQLANQYNGIISIMPIVLKKNK
jgi:hypothetical protein